jgi:hypothetical protein
MAIVDEFKSEKNRSLILQASNKMLQDKYKLSLNTDILTNIINAIIVSMSKDAILMNATIKLMELNTITLAKMKDYVSKNIEVLANKGSNVPPVPSVSQEQSIDEANTCASANANAGANAIDINNSESGYSKADVLTNEELLIRVKEYENNRVITNTILTNIESYTESSIAPSIQPQESIGSLGSIASSTNLGSIASSANLGSSTSSTSIASYIPDIIEKVMTSVLTSINTNVNTSINKKTLVINSYCRDWINNPSRNKLSFTVNIDLQNNIIEPFKILFPKYVKDRTSYITMVITDNHKTFKYSFIFSSTSGKWDIWKLIAEGENVNSQINLANKSWKIHFLDYIGNELNLGTDDIKISQINEYKMNRYDNNIGIDTNIDTILESYNNLVKDSSDSNDSGGSGKKKQDLYEINVDYSNQLEYDEYNLDTVSKYDYMLLKTYSNALVNIKVLDVNTSMGKIIMSNDANLKREDFVNSSLLNYGAQYSLILTYYPRRNIT